MTWNHASIPKFDGFKMVSDQEGLETIDLSTIERQLPQSHWQKSQEKGKDQLRVTKTSVV